MVGAVGDGAGDGGVSPEATGVDGGLVVLVVLALVVVDVVLVLLVLVVELVGGTVERGGALVEVVEVVEVVLVVGGVRPARASRPSHAPRTTRWARTVDEAKVAGTGSGTMAWAVSSGGWPGPAGVSR